MKLLVQILIIFLLFSGATWTMEDSSLADKLTNQGLITFILSVVIVVIEFFKHLIDC